MTDETQSVMTTEEWLELGQFRINKLVAGTYLIGQIYGEYWPGVPKATEFAKAFKGEVIAGHMKHIVWIERRSDNNHLYEVLPKNQGTLKGY